ncbi:hypothetical protein Tco_0035479, partial [Tanacetum coccineum]
ATPNESSSHRADSGGGPRVLDLEKTKTTQQNEIASLKRRVKKLEKKRSITHRLKRLRNFGATARVESSSDEESLGEDAFKQGRINAIDANKEIYLVSVQNVDEEMFDVNDFAGEEVFVAELEVAANKENVIEEEVVEVINTAKLIVDAAQVSTAGAATTVSTATTTTADDLTLAQELEELKSTKQKIDVDHQLAERLQAQEQE